MIDQTQINLHYVQAQARRIERLEKQNEQLKEVIEAMRLHLLKKEKSNGSFE